MSPTLTPLILDFLAYLAERPRPYHEVMEAWRTSCPRLTIWEDAVDAGLIERLDTPAGQLILPTASGRALLATNRAPAPEKTA
jgi:hypothetical protein